MQRIRACVLLLRALVDAVGRHKAKSGKSKKTPVWLRRAERAAAVGFVLALVYEFAARPLLDNFFPGVPLLPSVWGELESLFAAFMAAMEEG